ncbi:ER degradation-enhancing alpha-mannosidase-like protein 2 [Cryptotermes secundus]|uniref:alpha-1,2-Mannosidase n=2 Tax=Cryptotermes secundus TaxID=105785 RepID=A0A2J7Q555_9NEOP|nr:ER degradation-enhancing alpha-mannosidase-like protein 2 [Cryptotermes secundus]PNF23714.1 ER degradation-enhancing alpha-mannosidase-like protein 2 [Cryptotermes secundus]
MFFLRWFGYVINFSIIFLNLSVVYGVRKYERKDLLSLREEVRQMFQHAYDGYLKYAYPYDELRPLSCDGVDTWGSYSLTLIDALDTLAVMGNYSEFQRVVDIITTNANFDANINVSVFETNIRIIGGLLSAHLLSYRAGVAVQKGWPCNGPLLQLAEDVARRLIAAFDTTTGMPYGTVNLRHGVPAGETSITCTAGVGTFILEFGTLSRLTGDPLFEEVAINALYGLYHHRSPIGLVGNHIDVQTGRWTAQDAGIGAGVDSYYEYLAKGSILLQRPELMHMFNEGRIAIEKYLKRDDWHLWVSMTKGQVTLPVFQSLEAYWPGVLSLVGDVNKAIKSLHNYHQVWKQYGFTPEYYNIPQGEAGTNREGYPLRPELIESVMYLYRATGDPYLLEVGKDILRSIQHSARTSCGYATIKDVRDHRKEDRMESFFLAETTKYLYLLFDTDNFIHNRGQHGTVVNTPWGECVMEAGGYIFNTEAHPIDPGALHCCSEHRIADVQNMMTSRDYGTLRGDPLTVSHKSLQADQSKKEDKSSSEHLHMEKQTVPPIPSYTPENKAPDSAEDVKQFKKTQDHVERLLSDMGDAVDVIRASTQNDNQLQEAKETSYSKSEQYNKTVPTISIFDRTSEDFPVELNSNVLEGNVSMSEGKVKSDKVMEPELIKGQENKPVIPAAGTDDFLEYRADDSDRVYAVRNYEEGARDNDEDRDPEKLYDGSSVQHNFSDQAVAADSGEITVESEIRAQSGDHTTEEEMTDTQSGFPELMRHFLLMAAAPAKPRFDPQSLLERIRSEAKYKNNATWEQDYQLLSCAAQPFLQRLSMSGEIFDSS